MFSYDWNWYKSLWLVVVVLVVVWWVGCLKPEDEQSSCTAWGFNKLNRIKTISVFSFEVFLELILTNRDVPKKI